MIAGVLAGALVAAAARRAILRAAEPLRTRYFGVSVLLGLGLFMPAGLVFMLTAPAWSLMYLVHPGHVPARALQIGTALALAAAPPIGFAVVERLLPARRAVARYLLMVSAAIVGVAFAVWGRHRIIGVGHYDDFHLGGIIIDLPDSWLFAPSILTLVAVALGVGVVLRSIRRHLG